MLILVIGGRGMGGGFCSLGGVISGGFGGFGLLGLIIFMGGFDFYFYSSFGFGIFGGGGLDGGVFDGDGGFLEVIGVDFGGFGGDLILGS